MPDPSRAGRRRPAPGRLTNRETMTTSDLTRRSVVQGAAAVGLGAVAVGTLAACGSSTPAPGAVSPSSSAGSTTSGSAASGTTVAKADVPVGGGKVVDQVVVTQPTAGDFKAFTAVCTHNQCLVSKIEGGNIVCTCHGSTFDAATGAVKGGLATAPLAAKTVTVSGDNLVVS